jgi:hypothetical protein
LEVWGLPLAEGFVPGWFNEAEYRDYLATVPDRDWLSGDVELRSPGPLMDKPDALALTGDPAAEAIPARW